MFNIIGKLVINILALLVVEYLVPGFRLTNIETVVVTAIVIGAVNTFIRPVLQVIAFPISILTLGIFAFLINVSLLWFVSYIVPGFYINSFLTAAVASIVLSLVSAFLHKLARD